MKSDPRTAFLNTVRQALGHHPDDADARRAIVFPKGPAPASQQALQRIQSRTPQAREEMLARLAAQAKPLQLQVTPVVDLPEATRRITALAMEKIPEWGTKKALIRWSHPLLDALDLESALADQSIPVYTTRMVADMEIQQQKQIIREHAIASFMGITAADYCLADTATVVMKTCPHQGRAVSLVPAIHVVVLKLDQLLNDLTELYALLDIAVNTQKQALTHHMVFISGPSKTADIELTMVHGAHGPREMHIFVVRS